MYDKKKYMVKPSHGEAIITTDAMYGSIEQLVIEPKSKDTIWSVSVYDKDDDIIYHLHDYEGILNDRDGIPVGKDKAEALKFCFYELTSNEPIKVLINVKEK